MQEATLNEMFGSLTPDERQSIGMTPDELIKICTVKNGQNCDDLFNITMKNTVARGNCFTFNYQGEIGDVMSGPGEGLSMVFYLSREQYPWRPANDLVSRFTYKATILD